MKRCAPTDAAVLLLTTNYLDSIDITLLDCIAQIIKVERHNRSLTARETRSRRPSHIPSGPLGDFLFYLLQAVPRIRKFLTSKEATEVYASIDKRISILHKYSSKRHTETSANERQKFENFLAVRSLALSHEKYMGGGSAVATFASTLKGFTCDDEKLVVQGVIRGRAWRRLEQAAGVTGISAVACFESTLFIKGVPKDKMEECAGLLKTPTFQPILDLATEVTERLNTWQSKFDESVIKPTYEQGGELAIRRLV